MLPQDALREAIKLIEAGWCRSDGSHTGHARDANGRTVPLWLTGDRSKGINPDAVAFTAYGAIASVMARHPVERTALVFDVVYRLAVEANGHPPGGSNYVHPLLGFNEEPSRTKEQVTALLELAAQECERIGEGPFPMPPVSVEGHAT